MAVRVRGMNLLRSAHNLTLSDCPDNWADSEITIREKRRMQLDILALFMRVPDCVTSFAPIEHVSSFS